MQFKTNVVEIGSTTYLLIPKEVRDFLSLEAGQEKVIMQDYEKSKGRFIAFWKNEEKK